MKNERREKTTDADRRYIIRDEMKNFGTREIHINIIKQIILAGQSDAIHEISTGLLIDLRKIKPPLLKSIYKYIINTTKLKLNELE